MNLDQGVRDLIATIPTGMVIKQESDDDHMTIDNIDSIPIVMDNADDSGDDDEGPRDYGGSEEDEEEGETPRPKPHSEGEGHGKQQIKLEWGGEDAAAAATKPPPAAAAAATAAAAGGGATATTTMVFIATLLHALDCR